MAVRLTFATFFILFWQYFQILLSLYLATTSQILPLTATIKSCIALQVKFKDKVDNQLCFYLKGIQRWKTVRTKRKLPKSTRPFWI
ncbi:hypothetical protein HMPREF0765_1063 [Sphingobacterium spiritivorum ATCC 33300]|uniref:Uncharacterized protein n=1 Tax=Sphingobacterium spiritivorum ATCC 33300 TaxID=525372 RepID=C2FUQ7_SPHSI|nr:hypothetical protein HMPREF0765_1063 [Sphingobacterium spiritivorum ATCC 33300]